MSKPAHAIERMLANWNGSENSVAMRAFGAKAYEKPIQGCRSVWGPISFGLFLYT